jgi:ATP-dependent Lon protease
MGHEQTYVSSQPGIIIQSIIQSGVMNPVLFMDELDKVSQTDKGRDIQNVLVHLTDPVQNSEFQDKYFSGLQFDMSKVCFVFSYNDESLIHPILRDRLYTIRVKDPSLEDKLIFNGNTPSII